MLHNAEFYDRNGDILTPDMMVFITMSHNLFEINSESGLI